MLTSTQTVLNLSDMTSFRHCLKASRHLSNRIKNKVSQVFHFDQVKVFRSDANDFLEKVLSKKWSRHFITLAGGFHNQNSLQAR